MAKRKRKTSGRSTASRRKNRTQDRMPAGLITLFAGLVLMALAFVPGSSAWRTMHDVLFGVFGCGSFVLGAALCYLAILYTRGEDLLPHIAVLALGDIVCSTSLKVAGNRFTQLIIDYLRKERKLAIGEQMAEEVKIRIGSALPMDEPLTMEVSGLAMESGLPSSIEVNSNEIELALRASVDEIVRAVRTVMEITPPELAADIVQRGLMMTGGGALLRDLDQLLKEETGLPVHVAEEPLNCVVKGCGIALENMDKLRTAFAAG